MATSPDFQDWGYKRADDELNRASVESIGQTLRDRGATWLRVTLQADVDGDRFYLDGWRQRPDVESDFEILPAKNFVSQVTALAVTLLADFGVQCSRLGDDLFASRIVARIKPGYMPRTGEVVSTHIGDVEAIVGGFVELGAAEDQVAKALVERILGRLGVAHEPFKHGLTLAICGTPGDTKVPCKHVWDGGWVDIDNGGSASCSKCGTTAFAVSMREGI